MRSLVHSAMNVSMTLVGRTGVAGRGSRVIAAISGSLWSASHGSGAVVGLVMGQFEEGVVEGRSLRCQLHQGDAAGSSTTAWRLELSIPVRTSAA